MRRGTKGEERVGSDREIDQSFTQQKAEILVVTRHNRSVNTRVKVVQPNVNVFYCYRRFET